jgi:NADH-quinone oxidoreductase subunit H
MIVCLYFGGWLGPAFLPPLVWFIIKMFAFIMLFILLRASLPRPRYDQLLEYGWKILFPITLLNLMITAAIILYRDSPL